MGLLIAASNATDESKDQAYAVCTGVDDQEQIEAAQNKLPDGGEIVMSEGDFSCSAGLVFDGAPILFRGAGHATRFNFPLDEPGDCLAINSRKNTIRDFEIVGDKTNALQGLVVGPTAYCSFANLWIEDIVEVGVRGMPANSQNAFRNVRVKNAQDRGFSLSGLNNFFDGCAATRSSAMGIGGGAGFWINENSSTFTHLVSAGHDVGFVVSSYAQNLSLPLLSSEACNVGLRVIGNPAPLGIDIGTVMVLLTQGATGPPIDLQKANGVSIGNIVVRN